MRNKRFLLIAIFSFWFAFGLIGCASTQRFGSSRGTEFRWNGDIAWTIAGDGNSVEIIGFRGNNTDVQIPSKIQDMPVTVIRSTYFLRQMHDYWVFDGVRKITSVIIPDSVTTIEARAFEGNQFTNVIIPNGVSIIGNRAFANNKLTSIIIPDSVNTIGDEAFANNQLTSVTIPESVILGNRVFHGNNQLVNRPMSRQEQERVQQRAEQERLRHVEQARMAEMFRQAGDSTGNLQNTSWSYSQRLNNQHTWRERIDFGNGSFSRQSPDFFGNAVTRTGTFRVSGDTVIFLLEGEYSTGTIVGNSLTVSGGVTGNRVTFNRIQ